MNVHNKKNTKLIFRLQVMSIFSVGVLGGSYQFMSFMSRPKYSDTGSLLDTGNDLNMEGSIAEWVVSYKFSILPVI